MENTIAYTQGFLSGLGVILGFCLASIIMLYLEVIKSTFELKNDELLLRSKTISKFILFISVVATILSMFFQYSLLAGKGFNVSRKIEWPYYISQFLYAIMFLLVLGFIIWIYLQIKNNFDNKKKNKEQEIDSVNESTVTQ